MPDPTPGPSPESAPLSRPRRIVQLLLTVAIGAFAVLTYIHSRDPTILIVGVIAAAMLLLVMRAMAGAGPRPESAPLSRRARIVQVLLMLAIGAFAVLTYIHSRDPTILVLGLIAGGLLALVMRATALRAA